MLAVSFLIISGAVWIASREREVPALERASPRNLALVGVLFALIALGFLILSILSLLNVLRGGALNIVIGFLGFSGAILLSAVFLYRWQARHHRG